ncbi:MAG: winged helix-turn-helix transcriptional regulator [Candidatus Bathyarchaeota archaeon]|nr:winged helix-turn-helix transcriptional regulator [Candidatus Bathyarchaeota archaeon]MDH5780363.1 winged helix-turn-helix transcriptional regulator [Candidatus Bathyarchaeota archaeon]
MRKELPHQLLRELLKNSKRSDRELAKVLGVSQPTITRTRQKLEKNGIIEGYTIIPNFKKMGFEILGMTLIKMRPEILETEMTKRIKERAAQFPTAIFVSNGEGLNTNFVVISFNRNFTEYHNRLNILRSDWKDFIENIESFIISIGEGEYKRLSLTYLKDLPL